MPSSTFSLINKLVPPTVSTILFSLSHQRTITINLSARSSRSSLIKERLPSIYQRDPLAPLSSKNDYHQSISVILSLLSHKKKNNYDQPISAILSLLSHKKKNNYHQSISAILSLLSHKKKRLPSIYQRDPLAPLS